MVREFPRVPEVSQFAFIEFFKKLRVVHILTSNLGEFFKKEKSKLLTGSAKRSENSLEYSGYTSLFTKKSFFVQLYIFHIFFTKHYLAHTAGSSRCQTEAS